jgi:predicted nucleic acid-binding protein
MAVLQHVESAFDVLPYDRDAARTYGQICAAVIAIGRQPRRRCADLMIAATAGANGLPLYTSNPKDFEGLDDIVEIIAVARPARM